MSTMMEGLPETEVVAKAQQFKTLKYRPDFPARFGSPEHGRSFYSDFFPWYNTEHHHVGLGLFTPHDVHYGLAAAKREQRARVLAEAFARFRA